MARLGVRRQRDPQNKVPTFCFQICTWGKWAPGTQLTGGCMEIRDKNRKVQRSVVLGGFALVAVATTVYFSFFYPPSGKHVMGTIAPAARYRAEQIGKGDVKVEETDITRWTQTAE